MHYETVFEAASEKEAKDLAWEIMQGTWIDDDGGLPPVDVEGKKYEVVLSFPVDGEGSLRVERCSGGLRVVNERGRREGGGDG